MFRGRLLDRVDHRRGIKRQPAIFKIVALNPRVRGSSPWRRTRDQGSDLVFRTGSELFSCPLWTVVCSWCALEPTYGLCLGRTGRTRRHHRCGCRKHHPPRSGGMLVFVEEPAEAVAPADVQMRDRGWIDDLGWWPEEPGIRDAPVGPMEVVVPFVLAQG